MDTTTEPSPEAAYRAKCCSDPRTHRIRALNDALRRREPDTGDLVITSGVAEKGRDFVARVLKAVREFDAFTEDNDPHCEGDFGNFTMGPDTVFWKVDYYDGTMRGASPDPADPNVTQRVLTVMLAEEY